MISRLKELWNRRDLVLALAGRDLNLRYKGSLLGIAWSFLHPLVLAAVYTLAFRFIVRIPIPNYALFVLAGLLPWLFFSSALTTASLSIVDQGHLIKKLSFPREILPLATMLAQLAHFGLAYLIVMPLVAWYQAELGLSFLAVPFVLGLLAVFASGLGLLVATAQVYMRDTRHLIEVALQVWFWVTPIVYSLALVPEWGRPAFGLNPLVPFLEALRGAILDLDFPGIELTAAMTALAAVSFLTGYGVFVRGQRRFAEYV